MGLRAPDDDPDVIAFPVPATRIVVDFPAPFGPRKPVTLPGSTVNDRSSTASREP